MKYLLENTLEEDILEFNDFLRRKLKPNTAYIAEIKQKRENRSISQNRYYWYICTITALYQGEYKEDVHRTFAKMFIPKDIFAPRTGKQNTVGRSTTELDKFEFSIYVNQIRNYLTVEWGLKIPPPDKVGEVEEDQVYQEYKLMLAA